jgi:hypothetical protein
LVIKEETERKNVMEHTIKKYRLDIIVIAALLILSLSVILIINLTRKEGATVTVTVDGVTVAEYSLEKDGVYTLNGGSNILTIENGTARMSDSSCPDHICENKGKIKYVGQTIVCLPNKLTVTVTGEAEDDGVDFYS